MSDAVLFPNALDYVRCMHDNAVDNLLVGQKSRVELGSLYRRAYAVTYETGYVNLRSRFAVNGTSDGQVKR